MTKQLLAEVFGFPSENLDKKATRFRKNKLCPFHNRVPSCTKNSATDPLGVCSIFHEEKPVITCPIRFTEDWLITEAAANFFFPSEVIENGMWTSLREIRLKDRNGKSAGNIDYVLVSYDRDGKILDFGALEVQAVYISGNVTKPFKTFMNDPGFQSSKSAQNRFHPRPDFLSSSRKRLAPQLVYKGGILTSWGKKLAVVLQKCFYETMPKLPEVESRIDADVAWFIYDLELNNDLNRYELQMANKILTKFQPALDELLTPEPGPVEEFVGKLQTKLENELSGASPEAPVLTDILTSVHPETPPRRF